MARKENSFITPITLRLAVFAHRPSTISVSLDVILARRRQLPAIDPDQLRRDLDQGLDPVL